MGPWVDEVGLKQMDWTDKPHGMCIQCDARPAVYFGRQGDRLLWCRECNDRELMA